MDEIWGMVRWTGLNVGILSFSKVAGQNNMTNIFRGKAFLTSYLSLESNYYRSPKIFSIIKAIEYLAFVWLKVHHKLLLVTRYKKLIFCKFQRCNSTIAKNWNKEHNQADIKNQYGLYQHHQPRIKTPRVSSCTNKKIYLFQLSLDLLIRSILTTALKSPRFIPQSPMQSLCR